MLVIRPGLIIPPENVSTTVDPIKFSVHKWKASMLKTIWNNYIPIWLDFMQQIHFNSKIQTKLLKYALKFFFEHCRQQLSLFMLWFCKSQGILPLLPSLYLLIKSNLISPCWMQRLEGWTQKHKNKKQQLSYIFDNFSVTLC